MFSKSDGEQSVQNGLRSEALQGGHSQENDRKREKQLAWYVGL